MTAVTRAAARLVPGLLLAVAAAAVAIPAAGQEEPEPPQEAIEAEARRRAEAMRAQALARLRRLQRSPLQLADSLAADSLAADTLAADSAGRGPPRPGPGGEPGQRPDSMVAPPADTAREAEAAPPGIAADTVAAGPAPDEAEQRGVDAGEERAAAQDPAAGPAPGGPAATGQAPQDEAVRTALRELGGYAVTEYRGESARFRSASGRLELRGDSEVRRSGQSLATDSLIVFEDEAGVMCGYGAPKLSGARGDPVESTHLCYNVPDRVGVATGASTTFQQQGTWYVRGRENRVFTVDEDKLYAERTDFTSCELPEPHYSFKAGKVKMISEDVIVARNVTLNFEDVPVFWLPFMVQSLKQGRRSGILTPEFGLNDVVRNSSNFQRQISNVGFYWAVNEFMGAQVALDWFSENWTAVEARLDYRSLRAFLDGGVTVKRFWRTNGARELTISGNNSWQMDERTQIRVNGQFASSTDFVVQNSFDPRELNRRIESNAGLQRRFDWGNLNLSARRQQQITNGRVDWTLPDVSLSLSPVTLFENPSQDAAFYENITWNANGRLSRRLVEIDELQATASQRDQDQLDGNVSNTLRVGSFSLRQNASLRRVTEGERTLTTDSVPTLLPERTEESVDWDLSVNYQQSIIPGTTLTPSLTLRGQLAKSDTLGEDFISAPTRMNLGASLTTNLYGFLPGFGPFSRLRHRISPSFSYTYSPKPEVTELQRDVFGRVGGRETNQLSIGLNQTFEAKYREEEEGAAARDTATADSAALLSGEPRRLPEARKIMLLSINTSALLLDFAQEEQEQPLLTTPTLTNSLRSDLLQGFQLTVGHDLFRDEARDAADPAAGTKRVFDPHLSRVNASFSLDSDFFLFRALGLGGDGDEPDEAVRDTAAADLDPFAEQDPVTGGGRMVGEGPIRPNRPTRSAVGGFRASVDYSLLRPRGGVGRETNQMLRGNMTFRPTEHWSVRWTTGYSFTDGEFSDHRLTLTRDLHRWQANFDFVKAQNGNFALRFRVHLLDNPDLKFDYDQRSDPVRPTQRR